MCININVRIVFSIFNPLKMLIIIAAIFFIQYIVKKKTNLLTYKTLYMKIQQKSLNVSYLKNCLSFLLNWVMDITSTIIIVLFP